MRISLITLNARYSHSCPALFHVRQVLVAELQESRITIQQFTINDPWYDTLLAITEAEPEVLCFSISVWNVSQTQRLLGDLRLVLPAVPIVLGGPEVVGLDRSLLPEGCTVVVGEVEGLGPEFFADLAGGQLAHEYRAAPGPSFSMPYQPEDFAVHLANRNIYYESSRGCPFACSYCLSAAAHGMRLHDLDTVRSELAVILAHHPRIIRFVDRTFNVDAGRAKAIWEWLLAQPGETVFHFEIAPELFTEELFELLARVEPGRFQFEIGLQSTNPHALKAVNRTMDLARASSNINRLATMDTIHLHLDLILGLPYETEETFLAGFNHAFRLAPHHIQMGLLKVLPGTPLCRVRQDFGLLHSAVAPYAVLGTSWLNHPNVRRLYRFGECVEAFHNNRFFRSLFGYLRQQGEEPAEFFFGLLAICEEEGFFGLAKTQELMARLLVRLAGTRPDQPIFLELLRFDWLASGQHQLPEFLGGVDGQRQTKDHLWHSLSESWHPYFDHAGRKEFFKRATFLFCSAPVLAAVGLADGRRSGHVCFLPDLTAGVMPRRQTAVFFSDGAGK